MRTLPRGDLLDHLAGSPIDDAEIIFAHHSDHESLAIRRHVNAGRLFADWKTPNDLLRVEIDGGDVIRFLHRYKSHRTILRERDMAGRLAYFDALGQREVLGVVDVDAIQTEGDRQ